MVQDDKYLSQFLDGAAIEAAINAAKSHASNHHNGGIDAIKLDDFATPDDNTDLNASTTRHGLCPKLPGGTTTYLRGDGTYELAVDILARTQLSNQFKNVVTVAKSGGAGTANYICSDYASDVACFQAVLDSATAGSLIHVIQGDYTFTDTITRSEKDLTLIGIGEVNFLFTLPNSNDHGIDFSGSTVLSSISITSNASQGATSVVLNDVTGINAGQLILIYNNVKWNNVDDTLTGELYEVKSVDTGTKTVTLMEPLLRDYNVSDSSAASVYNPINVRIENINFIGNGNTDDQIAVYITNGKGCRIEKCNFAHSGLGSLYLATCYDISVNDCKINESELTSPVAYGYGIAAIDACAHIKIDGNTILSCRHCISCTGHATTQYPGVNRDIIITHNTVHGCVAEAGAIDSHPVTNDMTISHNKIHGTGWGINDGSRHSIIDHNEFYSAGGVFIRETLNSPLTKIVDHNNVHHGFLYVDTQASDYDYLQISDNYAYGDDGERYQIQFKNAATGLVTPKTTKSAKAVNIHDNRLIGATDYAMRLDFETFAELSQITIAKNQISSCGLIGLRLALNTTYMHSVNIEGNQVLNANMNNSSTSAIYCLNVQHANIINNQVTNTNGYTTTGIKLTTGCDYNLVSLNRAEGMTTAYDITGSNNTIANNI